MFSTPPYFELCCAVDAELVWAAAVKPASDAVATAVIASAMARRLRNSLIITLSLPVRVSLRQWCRRLLVPAGRFRDQPNRCSRSPPGPDGRPRYRPRTAGRPDCADRRFETMKFCARPTRPPAACPAPRPEPELYTAGSQRAVEPRPGTR